MNEYTEPTKHTLGIDVLLEAVKQYGELSTAYVSCNRNYCLETKARINFLESLITELKDGMIKAYT